MNLQQPIEYLETVVENLGRNDLIVTPAHGYVSTTELLRLARKHYLGNSEVYV